MKLKLHEVAIRKKRNAGRSCLVRAWADCLLVLSNWGGLRVVPTAAPAGSPERNTGLANLGFLTVLHEASGYLGGYLVTNVWGRPLEFRLSSAVQPNRVQHILYASTLEPYICADLIGKTLLDKTVVPVQLIITDRQSVVDLRLKVECPVLWLAAPDDARASASAEQGIALTFGPSGQSSLLCHPRFPEDEARTRDLLSCLDGGFDLAEPFVRIREAIGEARRMGVHK
jgi:hypothetical protein